MNNGANPKSQINGFTTDLIEISLIGTRLTRSDKSLIEGSDLGGARVELQIPLWGITPSLSPPYVWALLGALWLMIHSVGRCVSSINPPIDIRTHQRLSSASYQALMDSPSAAVVCFLGIPPPQAGSPIFCINKAQATSSNLVRVVLKGFLL